MELGTVVGRDGAGGPSGVLDHVDRSTVGGVDGAGLELSDHDVAALTIDEREDAVLVADVTDHGIGFEVTDSASILRTSGAFTEGTFAGQPTSGIVVSVPFSALLGRAAQMQVKASTLLSIAPDVTVDGLVADREPSLAP